MILITERYLVKSALKRFIPSYIHDRHCKSVIKKLQALDPETATVKQVNIIIGKESWTEVALCNECRGRKAIIYLGDPPETHSEDLILNTVGLCASCLSAAFEFGKEFK